MAALALRAERALAPKYERSELSFSVIVCRVHAIVLDESPQRRFMLEDIRTRARQTLAVCGGRADEHGFDLFSYRSHPREELLAAHLARLEVVPPFEHDGRVVQQLSTHSTDGTVALGERNELADQVTPANLAPIPVSIAMMAINLGPKGDEGITASS
jgi:hypothetical protein